MKFLFFNSNDIQGYKMKEQTLTEKQLQIVKANPVKNRKLRLGVAGAALAVTLFLSKPTTNVHAAVVDGNHNVDSVSQNTSNNDTKDDLAKTVDEQNETLQASKIDAPKVSDFASQPQTTQTAETHDDVQIIDHTQENGQNKQQEQTASNSAVTDPNEVPVIVDHTKDQAATTRPDIPVEVVNGSQTDTSIGQNDNSNDNSQTATSTKKKKGLQGRDGTKQVVKHASENIAGDDSSWQNVDYEYDPNTGTLTITGGKITNPKPLVQQFHDLFMTLNIPDENRINVVLANSNLVVSGSVKQLFGYEIPRNHWGLPMPEKLPNGLYFDGLSIKGLNNLIFNNVIDTSYLFENASFYGSADELSNLNTITVTNMAGMFKNAFFMDGTSLEIKLDTRNVVNMSHMFEGFNQEYLDLSRLDTNNVKDMSYMFASMPNIYGIVGLNNFVTNKVTDMSYLFYNNHMISPSDDIASWNTSNVINMSNMFNGAFYSGQGQPLDFSKWNTSKVIDFSEMFSHFGFLSELDLSNFNFSSAEKLNNMFAYSNLKKINVSNFKFNYGHNVDLSDMFLNCSSLTDLIGYQNWKTDNVNSLSGLFDGCEQLVNLDLSNWHINDLTDIFHNDLDNTNYDVSTLAAMFKNCSNLVEIKFPDWNTKPIKNMNYMFEGCKSLKSIDLSNFDTSNCTSVSGMFENCNSLATLDLSKFDTHNFKNVNNMFNGCTSLEALDLSNFDLSKAAVYDKNNSFLKPIQNMLANCSNLKQLTLGPKSLLVIFDDDNDVFTDAGLNNVGAWIAVADGTIDKPKGRKLYTSYQLMKAWDGSQDTETFVLTDKTVHDVKINYVDTDTKQVLATDTIQGFDGSTVDYANLYHDQLVKLGKQHYIRDTSADTVKFDNNHDVMMPDTVTDGLSYNIGVKKQFNATINYVDLNTGKTIVTDEVVGNSSRPIAYSAKLKQRLADLTKAGYTVVNGGKDVPLNADNDLQLPADISDDATYTYGIRSQFPITINYVDETGKVLAHDELKGNIDTELPYKSTYDKQVAALKANGYTVVDSDLAFNGQNKAENLKLPDDAKAATTFTVHLKAATYKITVNYVDADTGKMVKTDTVSGSKLEPIKYADTRKQSLAELNNQNYVVVDDNTPLNAKGDIQLPDSVTGDVIYTVNVREVHDVNVTYVDADTQKVLTSETVKGNSHKPLDYKARYDELVAEYVKKGYELVKTDLPFDASGNIQLPADKHDDFNYKVYLREVHQVTVNYVDLDTGKVVKTDTVKGNSHTPIAYADQMKQTLAELAQKGYTFDQKDSALPVDKNGNIQLPADLTGNVTYQVGVRTKKAPVSDNQPATVVGVIVHYRDNKGNQLAPDEQIVGQVGSSYLTHAKEIPGYTLETVRGHATGTIGQQIAKVTYYYVKDSDKQTEVPVKPNDNNQQPTDNTGNKKPDKNGKHDNNKQDAKKPAIIDHGTVIINPDGKNQVKIIDKTGKTVAHKQVSDPKQAVIKPELPQTGIKNGWSMVVSGLTMILLAVGSALGLKRKDEK